MRGIVQPYRCRDENVSTVQRKMAVAMKRVGESLIRDLQTRSSKHASTSLRYRKTIWEIGGGRGRLRIYPDIRGTPLHRAAEIARNMCAELTARAFMG